MEPEGGRGRLHHHAQLSAERILVVDDEEPNTRLLTRILERAGYTDVRTTNDPRRAVPLVLELEPHLVLLDLRMPGLDGLTVLSMLRQLIPQASLLPILVLTGDTTPDAMRRALSGGASDFLRKPFDADEARLRIRNLLETRALHAELQAQAAALERRVDERTHALEEAQAEILERLAAAAEYRDDDTGRHTQRVGEISVRLAVELGAPEQFVALIRRAAPLHDVGKIGIPDSVLLKPGRLTVEELAVMRTHTEIGARMLSNGRSPLITLAERIALHHHERWDGGGYPHGLTADEIPLESRIVAVADVFDALSHDRPYRRAWTREAVRAEIRQNAATHFDPRVAEAFLDLSSRAALSILA